MRLGGRIAAAVEVLDDMAARRRPVADALKDWGLAHRFAGSGDRAAIGNIVYDALRRRRSLAFRMDDDTTAALAYAAVIEGDGLDADGLAGALDGDRYAPPVPAAERLAHFLRTDLGNAPAAVAADVPDWLAEPLAASLGGDWLAEAQALAARPPLDLRVNALRGTREAALAELAVLGAESARLAPFGLRVPPIAGDGRHPNVQVERAFQTGLVEIQDEGSQIAALLAGARAGEPILDYCAGAGGKTLALAAAMGGEGELHAFDADRQRLAPIWDRLARAGASGVTVHAPRDDLSPLEDAMDLVLVDAPCTGSGTWRRRPDAKWRLTDRQLATRMVEQDKVLDAAARYVRPGGRLAYITCSVLRAENAERIESFLARSPGFRPLDARRRWAEALPYAPAAYRAETVGDGTALTLTPRLSGTDGFFFCLLERAA